LVLGEQIREVRCSYTAAWLIVVKAASLSGGNGDQRRFGQQLEGVVSRLVKEGRYNSKSEVLPEAVRLVGEREARLAALDAAIARGLADADAGSPTPLEEVSDRPRGVRASAPRLR
jgi:antitoxin ParD1/3/4